jgi:hypothetical protein
MGCTSTKIKQEATTAEAAREQREVELEGVEKAINSLRNEAHALEERRNELLSKLDRILAQSEGTETESVDKSDRIAQTHMLKRRCLEVDIKFSIQRTEGQEGTLKEVNTQLYELDQLSPPRALERAKGYYNACCQADPEPGGAPDLRFQGLLMQCCLEDQKQLRGRLEMIVRRLEAAASCYVGNEQSDAQQQQQQQAQSEPKPTDRDYLT